MTDTTILPEEWEDTLAALEAGGASADELAAVRERLVKYAQSTDAKQAPSGEE